METRKPLLHFTSLLLLLVITLSSCMDSKEVEDPYKRLEQDVATIDSYLAANGLPAIKDVSGVRMVIQTLGQELPAQHNSHVLVDYVGKLLADGSVFDQGTIDDDLSRYIDGWKIAFTTLPVGSKAQLYIPSGYGYGSNSSGEIPANSILVFDVDFIDVEESATEKAQFDKDTTDINAYLEDKEIAEEVIKDATGVRYVITQEGTGATADWYSKVKLKYTIKLLADDSKTVATVEREPTADFASRPVDYIHGLKVGLRKLSEGSKATLYVPSGLGFGTSGASDGTGSLVVPANANLIIDVEVIEVQ